MSGVLVGRERELRMMRDLLGEVRDSRGVGLLLSGEAGIGKSRLLNEARAVGISQGMRDLTTAGLQEERGLAFGGLHRLLAPLLGLAAGLRAGSRAALRVALGTQDGAPPELHAVALAALELMAEAASERPLLVLVDDAQWLDQPTQEVLSFVARRVSYEPIGVLIAIRDADTGGAPVGGVSQLRLAPLDDHAARELLDVSAPALGAGARRQLLREAAGNPLALTELPRALHAGSGPGLLDVSLLPLTQRLERAFASRLPGLPPATQALLLLAAADGTGELALALRAARSLGIDASAADLDPAITERLIAVADGVITFRHPLIRAAVYQAAGTGQRLDVHRVLHRLLAGDPDRAAWHLAAATVEPDEAVAAELESVADRAERRGALATAAEALRHSAAFSPGPADRARRLVASATLAVEIGRSDAVLPLIAGIDALVLTPRQQARIRWIREMADPRPLGSTDHARQLIELARAAAADGDADLALDLLWLVSARCWWAEPGQDAAEVRAASLAAAEEITDPSHELRVLAVAAYTAPTRRSEMINTRLLALRQHLAADQDKLRLAANAAFMTGAFDLAEPLLADSITALRSHGNLGHLPRMLTLQGNVAARSGDWNTAIPVIEEAERLGEETGQPVWVAGAQAIESMLAGARGDLGRAAAAAAAAEGTGLPMGASFVVAVTQLARGGTALAFGQYQEAYDYLIRLFDRGDPAHHWSMKNWAIADIAEAATRIGQHAEASHLLAEVEADIVGPPSFWLQLGLLRARALLDDEQAFDQALSLDLRRWPFQRARVLLDHGGWLRRRRQVAEARRSLRTAAEIFDALRAAPWSDRAHNELRATGETRRRRDAPAADELTPQELQIAQLAATGLSNKEIGEKLYLSHRTVSAHLYRVFPKLGVTSRAQLAATLAINGAVA